DVADADRCVNDVCAACRSRKSGSDTTPAINRPLYGVTTTARRSGSRMPWPRRNTPSTIEYMAVVIATPAASDRIANAVNSGVAASRLSASRVSVPIDAERSTAVVEQGSEYWQGRYQTAFTRMAAMGLPLIGPQYPDGEQCTPWPAELPGAQSLDEKQRVLTRP